TIVFHEKEGTSIGNIPWILGAMVIGTVIGWMMAMKVKMTAMPQMVSFFNGMGGACAAIISLVEYGGHSGSHDWGFLLIVFLGLAIGSVSFSGSIIAYGKLDGWINDTRGSWMKMVNLVLLVVVLGMIVLEVLL